MSQGVGDCVSDKLTLSDDRHYKWTQTGHSQVQGHTPLIPALGGSWGRSSVSSRPVIVRFCLKNKSIQDVLSQEAAALVRVAVAGHLEARGYEGRSGSIRARRQLREDRKDGIQQGLGMEPKASVC